MGAFSFGSLHYFIQEFSKIEIYYGLTQTVQCNIIICVGATLSLIGTGGKCEGGGTTKPDNRVTVVLARYVAMLLSEDKNSLIIF